MTQLEISELASGTAERRAITRALRGDCALHKGCSIFGPPIVNAAIVDFFCGHWDRVVILWLSIARGLSEV